MIKFLLVFSLIASCSSPSPQKENKSMDQFDYILNAMKTRDPTSFKIKWGPPKEIVRIDNATEKQVYSAKGKFSPLDVVVNINNGKIVRADIFFWENFDNYAYLKQRFSEYKWIEVSRAIVQSDVVTEPVSVSIPDLKISFEYDNQIPERKIMWIGFE